MIARQALRLCFAFVMILMTASVYAQVLNNEVEFSGIISSTAAGEGGGALFVDIDNFDLRVIVNPKTTLVDAGNNQIAFDALTTDAAVLVSGKFSSSGVLATRVQLLDQALDTFEVSGHITAVQSSRISLLGLLIETNAVEIDDPTALKPGTWVQVAGKISGANWIASSITVVDKSKNKGNLNFEGTVKSWVSGNPGILMVQAAGAAGGPTKVYVTADTRIEGELAEKAYVTVKGKLVNFDVYARHIEVIGPFEIKPDERKLKTGESADFTIKLREPAPAGGVTLTFDIEPSGMISLTQKPASIPAGERTAVFSVKADGEGPATITVTALNSSVPVLVKVGAVSESENERPAGSVRIAFAPDYIKLGMNESREVVLIVEPPQDVAVNYTVSDPTLVKVSESRELGNGVARVKVLIESLGKAAESAKVTASLGASVTPAELFVDLSGKNPGKKK